MHTVAAIRFDAEVIAIPLAQVVRVVSFEKYAAMPVTLFVSLF